MKENPMKQKILGILMACMLLSALWPSSAALGVEENVVQVLPALEPILSPSPTPPPSYDPSSLFAYYWDEEDAVVNNDYQVPKLTEEERARALALLLEYEKGARPQQSILNVTENVVVGVYELNPQEYDGEAVYVLLPTIALTDDQLLGLIHAYAELGLSFDPAGLSYRNCARGGAMVSTRFLAPEELDRQSLLGRLIRWQELRPETPLTSLPGDDGTGLIALNSALHAYLREFRFIPYRQTTDEELLAYVDAQKEENVSGTQLAAYEVQARQELRRLINAPLALELMKESMDIGSQQNIILGDRPVYTAVFMTLSSNIHCEYYYIMLDAETGTCRWLHLDDDNIKPQSLQAPAYDGDRTETARAYVESIRKDGMAIREVKLLPEEGGSREDSGWIVCVRVTMEDDGFYDLLITHQQGQVIAVDYLQAAAN